MPASYLRASGVHFGYSRPLLSDVDFQIAPGWTGMVGPNGAGKTTLLRLLAGELTPDRGSVRASGPVLLCPQLAEAAALSSGERKQRQVAAALRAGAAVLLLDEPTNHLDAASRAWLVRELRRFRGVGLLVSHDRALLDALCQATLRVAAGTARLHGGGYSAARAAWEAEEREGRAARDAAIAYARALRTRLADARRDQAGASAHRSAGRRMRSRYDSDARSVSAGARVDSAAQSLGRRVEVLRRTHERASAAAQALTGEEELGRAVRALHDPCPKPWLVRLDAGPWGALGVRRDDRIWVRGRNGAGKSTLLAALVGAAPRAGVLFVPQEVDEAAARSALRALGAEARGRALSVLAALGVDPAAVLASPALSPGEARKLLLAVGLSARLWGLLLDEPTNHLDLPSVERLEAALQAYPGALVLVTHDATLAAACTTRQWNVEAGRVEERPA